LGNVQAIGAARDGQHTRTPPGPLKYPAQPLGSALSPSNRRAKPSGASRDNRNLPVVFAIDAPLPPGSPVLP